MQASLEVLPKWLQNEHDTITSIISQRGKEHFEIFKTRFYDIHHHYLNLPSETKIFEIYKISATDLSKRFRTPNEAISHSCEALIGRWLFQHAHKFKAALEGFRYSLDQANFLLALSCARSMFEEAIHFHLYLSRIESAYNKAHDVVAKELPRLKKNKPLTEQTQKAFLQAHFDLLKVIQKSLEGSDYNWKGWREQLATDNGLDLNAFVSEHKVIRKTHINDCIEGLEKRKGMAVKDIYDFLSEMVHPNYGSNTLVVLTRNRMNDISGDLILSSCPKNAEAAAWFFETSALLLAETFDIDLNCTKRANAIFESYMNWSISFSEIHKSGLS